MTLRRLKDLLCLLALMGLAAAALRMVSGLGATTDLSDEIPWGLWKVLNMIAGVALATGGFVLAFAVHVLGVKSLKPILRPALLVAFLGYGASCAALLFDIGLPHRFWHPMVFWNPHSFLFEVFWCVMLYFTVTVIEVSPIALENSKWRKLHGILKKIGMPVVICGITFSTLHHSSLGSLFLVSPTRIHEIWYTPYLPLHFILSAVGAGMMSVVLLTLVTAKLYHRSPPDGALRKVAGASAVVLAVSFVVKSTDLAAQGALGAVFSGEWESKLFLFEILCAAVIPVTLVAIPRIRNTRKGLAAAAGFAVLGLLMNRLDVGIFSYFRSGGVSYVPSAAEIALTLGIPAAAGLFFFAFVERFRVFDFGVERLGPAPVDPVLAFQQQTGVWQGALLNNLERLSLMAVFVLPIALGIFTARADADPDPALAVGAPLGADAARSTLKLDGDRNGKHVLFPHDDHKARLGGEESCATCHHLDKPGDRFTSCRLCHTDMLTGRSIFDHELHVLRVAGRKGATGPLAGNESCAECHDARTPRSRRNSKSCHECHAEDMRMDVTSEVDHALAPSYKDALHQSCVGCHDESAEEVGRRDLGECRTCHE